MLYTFVIYSMCVLWTRGTATTWSWVHILVSQTPTGGSIDIGMEYTNAIHFCPMFYRFIMDNKKNYLQFSLALRNPFFYCLDQIWVHFPVC
jgi:hypothetical protein